MIGSARGENVTELVVFDLDGTLVDSRLDIVHAVCCSLQALGVMACSEQAITGRIGVPLVAIFEEFLPPGKRHLVERAISIYREVYLAHCTDQTVLYAGVLEGLDRLSGISLAIATTKKTHSAIELVRRMGLIERFALVQGTEEPPYKPHPAVLHAVLHKLGHQPENCWMVGDTVYDIQAGRAAGMRTCAVTYGYASLAELAREKPDRLVDSLAELPGGLDGDPGALRGR